MTSAPMTVRKKHGYSSTQIALHWTVVGLVAVQWFLGWPMSQIFEARQEGTEVALRGAAYVHIALGISIFVVMLIRLSVKLRRPVEVAPDSDHPTLRTLGKINHWAFYAVLLALPLGGIAAWFGRSEAAGAAHSLLAILLPVLIAIHVSASLFHHFVLRDGLIRRMLRPTGGT